MADPRLLAEVEGQEHDALAGPRGLRPVYHALQTPFTKFHRPVGRAFRVIEPHACPELDQPKPGIGPTVIGGLVIANPGFPCHNDGYRNQQGLLRRLEFDRLQPQC